MTPAADRESRSVSTVSDPAADLSIAYRWKLDDVVATLKTDLHRGLTEDDVRSRRGRFGPNELPTEPAAPGWRRLLAQFQDVLVILLLVATAISAGLWSIERDAPLPYEATAIVAVVLLNAAMGYIQESRAEAAVAALRAMSAADATVVRDGERRSIPRLSSFPASSSSWRKATRFRPMDGSSSQQDFKLLKPH